MAAWKWTAANNVFLSSGRTITVNGLSSGARIGVTTASASVTFATGASEGEGRYFFCDNSGYHVEQEGDVLLLVEGAPQGFTDPEGVEIADPAIVDWLLANNFTQSDINALGSDSAATEKLYECFLLNCSIKAGNPGGALSITGIAVNNGQVSVTVQLVHQSPLGYIHGTLYLCGASDLAVGFGRRPISEEIVDFRDGDSIFDVDSATIQAGGSVMQTVTATFGTRMVTEKFFKAKIAFPIPEEPWEPEPEPDPVPEYRRQKTEDGIRGCHSTSKVQSPKSFVFCLLSSVLHGKI